MGRADRRRNDRKRKKEEAVYQFTKSQLDTMINSSIEKRLKEIKSDATNVATNTAMVLMFCLPLKVMIDKYEAKNVEEFADYLLDYYSKWQDGDLDLHKMQDEIWDVAGIKFERDI